jgi:hypothetical protein
MVLVVTLPMGVLVVLGVDTHMPWLWAFDEVRLRAKKIMTYFILYGLRKTEYIFNYALFHFLSVVGKVANSKMGFWQQAVVFLAKNYQTKIQ